jgi:hypothetical protein
MKNQWGYFIRIKNLQTAFPQSLRIFQHVKKKRGKNKAVIGGWDPSARKFFKTDALSFTVPFNMFMGMVNRYPESFLKMKTWAMVRKKIERRKKTWGEN